MDKRIFVPISALLLSGLLSGCFLLPREAEAPELPLVTPYAGADYATAEVVRGDLVSVSRVSFTYSPTRKEDLRFSVADRAYGVIYVSVGDEVTEGQLLAELDTAAETAAIRETENALERLRIQLQNAYRELNIALEEEALLGGGSTVTSDARRSDISYYQSSIDIYEKRLEEQQTGLEALRLYAPFDGTVTYVKTVDRMSRSGKADTVVSVTDAASAVFTARTADYALFPVGETFTVTAGEEEYLCVSRDPADFGFSTELMAGGQKNVCLELLEANVPEGSVRGETTIVLETRENVNMVVSRAVFTVGERSYVYHEDETGLKTAQEVTCGLDNGSYVEIIDGLEEGDYVIIG